MSATADVYVDAAELLEPIPGNDPCGEDLKWTGLYDDIRRSRSTADKAVVESDDAPSADWNHVVNLTTEALKTQTKDLMLAGWLTEALVHQHGFGGLRDGLRVVTGLLNQFWDGVFPKIEDGDMDARLAPLRWLTSADSGPRLPNLIRDVRLAPSDGDESMVFSWNLWNAGMAKAGPNDDEAKVAEKRRQAEERKQRFERAVAGAGGDFYRRLHREIVEAQQELKALDKTLDEKFQQQAPGTTAFREAVDACRSLAAQFLKQTGGDLVDAPAETEAAETTTAENGDAASRKAAGGGNGPIRDRVDALKRLEEVAAFLRQTEPQSPVPYLIERAISWGRMPFHQLLDELLHDAGTRGQVRDLLGLRPNSSDESPSS
jgi:type VI secretion system protein ImpA